MTELTRTRPIVGITGGSAGIGPATVREFANSGYDVAVLARGRAGLDGAARSVETVGGGCLPISVDVADEATVEAATDRVEAEQTRRNMWVGISTVYTVLGNRVAPAIVDWYLGKTGVQSQQTDQDAPRWGSNVFEPQDDEEDRGARGAFSAKAADHDPVSFVASHRVASLAAAGTALSVVATTLARRTRR